MKKWYMSKTLWTNALMLTGSTILAITGSDILNVQTQLSILAVVNVILRLITKQELTG